MLTDFARSEFERRLDAAVDAFEQHCRDNPSADVRDYLPQLTTDENRRVAIELLCVDLQYHWQRGNARSIVDYEREFPEWLADKLVRDELAFEAYRQSVRAGEPIDRESFALQYGVDTQDWPTWNTASDESHLTFNEHNTPRELQEWEWLEHIDAFPVQGDQVGEFTIECELGRGAFAIVYRAKQVDLADRPVVLKMTIGKSIEPSHLARLVHTHIMPIHSVHSHDVLQVICMPYLGRTTVQHALNLREAVPRALARNTTVRPGNTTAGLETVDGCLRIIECLAEALEHSHGRGIVHSDLKPANVLLADDGSPLLMDFNLADDFYQGNRAYLIAGGTLPYLSPEHLQSLQSGERPTCQSDLYSLGVILYQLLAGTLPFPQRQGDFDSLIDQMIADRQQPQGSIQTHNPDVPPSIGALVSKLLAPQVSDRYDSATSLLTDLRRHRQDRPLLHAGNPSWSERLAKFSRRHPRLTSGSYVGMLSAFLIAVLALWSYSAWEQARLTRANMRISEVAEALPELRAIYSYPASDAPTLSAANLRLQAVIDEYQLDAPAQGGPFLAVHSQLSPRERQKWTDTLSEYLFLAATHWQQQGCNAATQYLRQQAWTRAMQLNRQADRLLHASTSTAEHRSAAIDLQHEWLVEQLSDVELSVSDLTHSVQQTPAANARNAAEVNPTVTFQAPADLYQQAVFHLSQTDFSRAVEALEPLRDRAPHDPSVWLLLGNAYAGAERFAEAEGCYSVCLSMWPESHLGPLYRGIARLQQHRAAAAIADFDLALTRLPGLVSALINRAAARGELGDTAGAEADLTQAIACGATQTRVYLLRANLRRELGNLQGAAEDEQRGLELTPMDEVSWVQRGLAQAKSDPQAAIQDLLEAARINPRSRLAWRNLAYVYGERLKELEPAIECLDRLIVDHQHADDYVSRGVYRARLGHDLAAIADVEAALARARSAKVLFQAACIYSLISAEGQPAEAALAYLEAALALDPSWSRAAKLDPDLENMQASSTFQTIVAAAQARYQRLQQTPLSRPFVAPD